ncbi:MAG TPA: hypothetical protein VHL31_04065 [Geminicoccus sp.]|jgi:hypothetical protein|uniref:hypothetical protein n=1 Tax=Geminicoccus sp. TaxID=2024832 RepID=UPI002E3410FF|nr:hypothetical protein [Geminicoccus sp.]HEX2525466.1 hypothetical protein [Geminicoccus sp.]
MSSRRTLWLVTDDDEPFKGDRLYIGEAAEHLTLAAHSFGDLVRDPGRQYRNRTTDLLFKSMATHAGHRMIDVAFRRRPG